jgi:integrase
VRVYRDHRIAYWTGGAPGLGTRLFERCTTAEDADQRATSLRAALRRGLGDGVAMTLDDAMQSFVDHLRRTGSPVGTIRAYKSNYNTWVPPAVGAVRLHDLRRRHWTTVFDALAASASPATATNVNRTLRALIAFCEERDLLPGDAFGTPERQRQTTATQAIRHAARHADAGCGSRAAIELGRCPDMQSVLEFAGALERVYPRYGRRLVLSGLATGLRICELLALRVEDVDLIRGFVVVDKQLDRYQHWPAVRPTKGSDTRDALILGAFSEVLESLVADASRPDAPDPGWLFPRHRSELSWADQAGKLVGAARRDIDWPWTFHWLRHAYASWLLAPRSIGGYGRSASEVKEWLGHKKLSTTLDTYVHALHVDPADLQRATRHGPGDVE